MTEAEWMTCRNPERLLAFAGKRVSHRKVNLFHVARLRALWAKLVLRPGQSVEPAVYYAARDQPEQLVADADLLRHIIGNPFHPASALLDLPSTITRLAEALHACTDCAFALRDALLESGHVELAEHFTERDHPKGCWALDLILGKW